VKFVALKFSTGSDNVTFTALVPKDLIQVTSGILLSTVVNSTFFTLISLSPAFTLEMLIASALLFVSLSVSVTVAVFLSSDKETDLIVLPDFKA